jgi:anaerobic selenocysteine-containing dehydrogenase
LQSGPDGTIEAVVNPTFTHYYHGTPWKFPPDDLELKEFFPISLGTVQVSNRAIINPEKYYIPYKVEALMSYGENGIMNNANSDEVVESYKHIPFVFNIAYHFDEPTMLADIVLPEPSNLERWAIYMATPCRSAGSDTYGLYSTNFRYPVVSPVYNTMQAEDIYNEIADRAGFLFGPGGVNFFWNIMLQLPPDQGLALDKKYTWKEIVDIRLKGMYGPDKGADYFKQESFIAKQLPLSQAYNYFYHPEARVEIYARSLQDVGRQLKVNLEQAGVTVPGWNMDDFFFYYQPMPDWKDTHLQTAPAEFDLYIINWKISPRNIGISGQDDNVWLREIVEKWDATGLYLLMNADTAKAKGIHDGDRVIVESQHGGRVDGLVRTSQLIHPEVLGTAGQAGHRSLQLNPVSRHGFLFNYLLTADDGLFCQSSGGLDGTARVKVYKA